MITCIGTITKDKVHFDGKTMERLGGAPTFFNEACIRVGAPAQIVSKTNKALFSFFSDRRGLQEGETTTLQIVESGSETKCVCTSYSGPVDLTRVPRDLLDVDILFISTLYDDIGIPETTAKIAIDLQGFMRPHEQILCDHSKRAPANLDALLRRVHILKCNEHEARTIFGSMSIGSMIHAFLLLGPRIVMITMGRRGVALGFEDTVLHLQADVVEGTDTVGAGDAFFSFFLIAFDRSEDVIRSAREAIGRTAKLLEERK